MKKLLLTGVTAALFSIAAIAQDQDTTRTESNEFRQETEQELDQAGDEIQQESNEFRRDAQETGQDIEQGVERTGDNIEQGVEEAGNEIEQGAERAGDEIEQGAQNVGDEINEGSQEFRNDARDVGQDLEQGAERTGDQIEESAEDAGDEMGQATDETLNEMNQEFQSTVEDSDYAQSKDGNNQASSDVKKSPEVKVVESKAGPNNEVVYEYQGEYFYVDRDAKKLVKADKSELKNAEHEVIVHGADGENADQNASSSARDNR